MNLSNAEKEVLSSFVDGSVMTLKMVASQIRKTNQEIGRQTVWNALQLLVARNLVEKIDRGVYKKV